MRQPPTFELSTTLAWLLAVSVVGALLVALAAAEAKRSSQSQNKSWRPWDGVVLLAVLRVAMDDLPGWVGFVIAAGGMLLALAYSLENGIRGTCANRQTNATPPATVSTFDGMSFGGRPRDPCRSFDCDQDVEFPFNGGAFGQPRADGADSRVDHADRLSTAGS